MMAEAHTAKRTSRDEAPTDAEDRCLGDIVFRPRSSKAPVSVAGAASKT
jgi:hypothetical protein